MRTKNRIEYERVYNIKHPWASKPIKNRLLYNAKSRAKKAGLDFNISIEDIIIPEYCPYLGIKLIESQRRTETRRAIASLDRIDNTKGYVKGNVEVISHLANTMKNNADPTTLLLFADAILKRYKNE